MGINGAAYKMNLSEYAQDLAKKAEEGTLPKDEKIEHLKMSMSENKCPDCGVALEEFTSKKGNSYKIRTGDPNKVPHKNRNGDCCTTWEEAGRKGGASSSASSTNTAAPPSSSTSYNTKTPRISYPAGTEPREHIQVAEPLIIECIRQAESTVEKLYPGIDKESTVFAQIRNTMADKILNAYCTYTVLEEIAKLREAVNDK